MLFHETTFPSFTESQKFVLEENWFVLTNPRSEFELYICHNYVVWGLLLNPIYNVVSFSKSVKCHADPFYFLVTKVYFYIIIQFERKPFNKNFNVFLIFVYIKSSYFPI